MGGTTTLREELATSVNQILHRAIDERDYDLVSACTEFGKRLANLKAPKNGSGTEQEAVAAAV